MKETIETIAKWQDPKQMLNKKFNSLQVLSFVGSQTHIMPCGQKSTKYIYHCKCDCGRNVDIDGRNIVKGRAKSCGRCGYTKTHSSSRTRLYRIWCNIKTRCYNKNAPQYYRYGARGIEMCDSWFYSFENFKNWAITQGYADNLTIDRINNNGDYKPENCRWVDLFTQNRNKTDNNKYQDICLTDWAKILKVKRQTLSKYVKTNGWEKAIERFNKQIPQTIGDIAFWHSCFFKDATLDGQITKFNEEWDEYFWAKTPEEKIKELADVFIVACGISRFDLQEGLYYIGDAWQLYADSPFGWDDLGPAIEAKMKRNRARTWGKTAEGTYHHTNEE